MLNCVDTVDIGHCCPASMHRNDAVPLAIFSGTDTQDDYSHYDKEHYSPNERTNVCTHTAVVVIVAVIVVIVVIIAVVVVVVGIVITASRRQTRKTCNKCTLFNDSKFY